jgi:transcriptional regulator with XRE-family HTH domain
MSIVGMDIRKLFGQNLRRMRLTAKLSQEAVAEGMGVDRAHVSSMERGQQNVTLLTVWQAAQALGCRPAAFLDESAQESVPVASMKAPRRKRTKS